MKAKFLASLENFKTTKTKFASPEPFYFNLKFDETKVYKNVCIVGGGLAGYLTALAFRKFFDIPVTVIESAKIPPIGVGEATTPILQDYLFEALGLDRAEFYKAVEPTWKLGIKFFWGQPGDYTFNYPFDSKDILSSLKYKNSVNHCSLNSILMSNDLSFVTKVKEGNEEEYYSLGKTIKYAFHIDNQKFIKYLRDKGRDFGVEFKTEEIVDAKMRESGDEIDCLVNDLGESFKYEMYVDCSGFKSMLLEKKLNSKYIPYKSSLFNNSAITTTVPNTTVKCYTYAESMECGWCWNIPLRNEDHRGYVFSSDFITDEQAYEELLRKNPTMDKNVKFVRFRSGRHEEFIKGNVVAIGNSYSFVEPLESTGVHMIIEQIIVLMNNFLNLKGNHPLRKLVNDDMNAHWDYIRWFLSIHFKFNRKFDNEYWTTSRREIDSSGFQMLLDLYRYQGFLSFQDITFKNMVKTYIKDTIFDVYGIDHILAGQGIYPKDLDRISLDNKKEWTEMVDSWYSIANHAIPIKDDLKVLLENPEFL
ncbi:tryptophan 7-halogenase [Niabella sp.]|uniref:tryptophan 7-halogenase n=1 Tax=Niabella sp. TaxID=1962976 RepID=UPI002623FA4D|nr:tryptophan 7-halogenase [Niabella sp.]